MIWSKHEIRQARKLPLLPILSKMGYSLRKLEHGNYLVEKHGSVVIKDNYWFWKENQSAGNAIDFFTIVEKRPFAEAMTILAPINQSRQDGKTDAK